MKRTPKTTRKERQEKNGIGPAQAHFPSGRNWSYVSPTKTIVRRVETNLVAPGAITPVAGCCPSPKFKTVSKKENKYVCRRCGTPTA